jgi:hypothetical protein
MANLVSVLKQLEQERNRLAVQVEHVNQALSALDGTAGNGTRRTISAVGRARIAAAQRARWAKGKGKVVPITAHKKRRLSATALAHIRAAQKARWAKWRKQQNV